MLREVSNMQYLIPVEQNLSWLKQGCKFCFYNDYFQLWNLGISDEYMRCLGLPQGFNRKILCKQVQSNVENKSYNRFKKFLVYESIEKSNVS